MASDNVLDIETKRLIAPVLELPTRRLREVFNTIRDELARRNQTEWKGDDRNTHEGCLSDTV